MFDLSNLKPNTLLVMTVPLDKVFKSSGCIPTCHCCNTEIKVGAQFKLGSVSDETIQKAKSTSLSVFKSDVPHDVMLCSSKFCTPEEMITRAVRQKNLKELINRRIGGGCSIVDGKIVV
jgi:hypothetical protein